MEPNPHIQSPKHLKEGILILLVIVLAFSIFTPRCVEYSDFKFIRYLPGMIDVIVVPLLLVLVLVLHKGIFKPYYIVYGIVAIIVVRTASTIVNSEAKTNELSANGVLGKAVVIDKKTVILRNEVRWQIKCSFMANNHRFETLYERDYKNTYKKGDTLEILYNKDYPKMYELKRVH
jgi:hypothetical protein